MILYHCTPRKNLCSIFKVGLLPNCATGKAKVVWLAQRRKLLWALEHVAHCHKARPADLAVIRLDVPDEKLRRYRKGVFRSPERIDARHFEEVDLRP